MSRRSEQSYISSIYITFVYFYGGKHFSGIYPNGSIRTNLQGFSTDAMTLNFYIFC
jgi:hypothetical protein